jgi:hypothetical protein
MVTALEKAVAERESQKATASRLEGSITEGMDEVDVEIYLEDITSLKESAMETQIKLVNCVPADIDDHRTEHDNLMKRVTALLSKMRKQKAVFDKAVAAAAGAGAQPHVPSHGSSSHIHLKKLEPPKFDGRLSEWLSFKDLFTSTIHNDASMPKALKLSYLRMALTGEATKILKSMDSTDDNYDVAWEILVNRYQNERELFFSILKRFTNQPVMTAESSAGIRNMIDVSKECIRSLSNLKVPVDSWDGILVFLMVQKLDPETKKAWELSLDHKEIPKLSEFEPFLEQRARALAVGGSNKSQPKSSSSDPPKKVNTHFVRGKFTPTQRPCKICNSSHPHHLCPKLIAMPTTERKDIVRKNNLCFNCLKSGHGQDVCLSPRVCGSCSQKHHTLLHVNKESTTVIGNHMKTELTQTMLATAMVKIEDKNGQLQVCRALLDGGSTASFISESCVKRLGLKRSSIAAEVVGLGSTHVGTARGIVAVKIHPHFSSGIGTSHSVNPLIMNKVTDRIPADGCDPKSWPHLQGLQLADPNYHKSAGVDILLGGDVFWDCLLGGKIVGCPGSPIGLCTTLGWLVAGNMDSTTNKVIVNYAETNLEEQVQKFWELESVPATRTFTKEEKKCEEHFSSTVTRDDAGRFVVTLPLKEPVETLGSSREMAIRRFKSLEKRLEQNPAHNTAYHDFMHEYMELGHMELVPEEEVLQPKNPATYIPHHFVQKEESTTTKFRVVFDASAKTSSGKALNDVLMVGPTLQESLISNLIRFRTHEVALTADVEKMYRQILVKPSDRDLQRIVWRESPKDPILTYRLRTATYGTASAPYHATKALQVLAEENREDLPLASAIAGQDFYVDDLMSGAPDVQTALKAKDELLELMKRGGLHLRKWSSNSTEVLESLPSELRETKLPLSMDLDEVVKTLGLRWNPATDEFSFKVSLSTAPQVLTKRILLSEMAKIFDPLGWLAPAVIRAKIIIQKLWKLEMDWDEPLPEEIGDEWLTYRSNLPCIEKMKIPRLVRPGKATNPQLFGFCDASQKAYAAVVYLRVRTPLGPRVSLITAKTRVAPSKTISLPRLELCGSLLLAHLMETTQDAQKIKIEGTQAWTDSTVVLAWLKSHPSRWKTFVANRVTEITDFLPFSVWGHVAGYENPADCASRGIDPSDLPSHSLWWRGPSWLYDEDPKPHHIPTPACAEEVEKEEKKVKVEVNRLSILPSTSLLHRVSSLKQLKRYTAYWKRFVGNCHASIRKGPSTQGPLSSEELEKSLLWWIKLVQDAEFGEEIRELKKGNPVSSKSKLKSLNPFLDSSEILRVGGRLRHAAVSVDQKNPILLPRHSRLTELIIQDCHDSLFHAGGQLILSVLNRRFWIIGAKDAIRHQNKKCVVCTRHRGATATQIMGDLPTARVNPARAFVKCGVDYAGPFTLRAIPGRSKVTFKGYLALFVCLTTRAVHLEIVSSLSTDAFLAALKRFTARRGKSSDIYSDCGTNFVGASKELKELLALVNSNPHQQRVSSHLANEGIRFHFNPPSAPHFGGLWEAGVKSVKHHLHRVVGNTRLTFEEMTTLMAQIEACLNSRPLTPISTDPNDLCALTPGHFLIGESLTAIPEPDITELKANRLSRWQLVQQLYQHFWRRWSGEYLSRLQQRPKWLRHRADIRVNDMVIIKDERFPPLKWKLGRVMEIQPGDDGHTRAVTVRTSEGEFQRPIAKLCLLPIDPAIQTQDEEMTSDSL